MTAPAEKAPDPLAEQKRRLRDAAYDLERVAELAQDVIEALAPDEVKTALPDSLHAAIVRMHDEEHGGPMRWCRHRVCVEAQS